MHAMGAPRRWHPRTPQSARGSLRGSGTARCRPRGEAAKRREDVGFRHSTLRTSQMPYRTTGSYGLHMASSRALSRRWPGVRSVERVRGAYDVIGGRRRMGLETHEKGGLR
jgi:hypothetical protein